MLRSQHQADGFLTTEKDIVRMGTLVQKLMPIFAVRLSIQIEDATQKIDTMLTTIAARRGRS
jgi:tetraacyldisaccharide-1-P 4'-kinase